MLIKISYMLYILKKLKNYVMLFLKTSMFHEMQDMVIYFTYVSPERSVIYNGSDKKDGVIILEPNQVNEES